jgi:14-3-3 protein epsilon
MSESESQSYHDPNEIPDSFTREDFIYLAKIAEQTERFDEMIKFVKKFVELGDNILSPDERYVFATAFKNAVGNRRAELRVLTAIEQKEIRKGDDSMVGAIKSYKTRIEKELSDLCYGLLDLIEKEMLPKSKNPENQIYFLKMKGDYNRYLSEFLDEEECTEIVQKGLQAYSDAEKLAKHHLPATHPMRLGVYLNMSVFYYEILQEPGRALMLTKSALDEALGQIDSINEEMYKDCTLIMQLLRDNLTLWSSEIPGTEEPQADDS